MIRMPVEPKFDAWIRCPYPKPNATARLFCFPYAGGGASVYRAWGEILPDEIEVCPVQLPGREDRLAETPFSDLRALTRALAPAMRPYLDKPFAFFGHSMGALVAYELARTLRRQTGSLPAHLFVSGRGAPHWPNPRAPIHVLPDAAMLAELHRRYRGVPESLWREPELLALLLPLLRADLTLAEAYAHVPEPPLSCSISAFGGDRDPHASHEALAAWRDQAADEVPVRLFAGDHFYLNRSSEPLLQAIAAALSEKNFHLRTQPARRDSDFP
jgi:medium-chain acyl-[acyl-carrier-protein] hydrolase